jgi:hypothetical protein
MVFYNEIVEIFSLLQEKFQKIVLWDHPNYHMHVFLAIINNLSNYEELLF